MAYQDLVERSQKLLPSILEHRAQAQPDRIWAQFPISPTSYTEGFRVVTYAQMRNAVDRVAWILHRSIGPSKDFQTIAYLGPNDLRYHIVLLAAIKTGYKAFFPSPRNSLVAQMSLLSRLQCSVMVTTDPEPPFVSPILRDGSMQRVCLPGLETLLKDGETPPYPYQKSFQEAKEDPIFVLHTSGSTGIPKPIIYTHEFVSRIYCANSLPVPDGTSRIDDLFLRGTFFSMLPGFHIAGIGWGLILPMFSDSVPVFPLPSRPPSTDGFVEAVKHGTFDWAFLLPVIIDELSRDPSALGLVSAKLQYLFYTGGALTSDAGDLVSSSIPVFSGLGSSECAAFPQIRVSDTSFTETWKYLCINPLARPEFRQQFDDVYELVIVKSTDCPEAQPVFAVFPELEEYETRDLFSPHPSIPDLWRHRGRRDDIIVFLNGEKTNPISFEEEVSKHPEVSSALVAGNQRVQACLLVEPVSMTALQEKDKVAFITRIWPAIEQANLKCPTHARIIQSNILIMDPSRPMMRASKGTVQRAATLNLYAEDIDALYNSSNDLHVPSQESITTREEAVERLRDLISKVTSWAEFENDQDFFALGMDSAHVLQLSSAIRHAFNLPLFAPRIIYGNPSVRALLPEVYPDDTGAAGSKDDTSEITTILQHYQQQIDSLNASQQPESFCQGAPVVLLTGSTGVIGSYILDQLLARQDISHIYCLNRGANSQSKQCAASTGQKLPCDFPSAKVTFLQVDLTKANLGLDQETYNLLLNTATEIIHNAWPINFNLTLPFFKPSLDGIVNLVSFASRAHHKPSLLLLSSISSVAEYHRTLGARPQVPERVITDISCSAPFGYAQSKYVAERLLDYAAKKFSFPCGVARVGQVSGTAHDPHGWKRTEWLPSLILSSRYLKRLPVSLGSTGQGDTGPMDTIDWVPVDEVAAILMELSSALVAQPSSGELRVFHCINPHPISWKELIPTVVEELSDSSTDTEIPVVGFQDWVSALQASVGASSLDDNPGVKLIPFYEELAGDKGPPAPLEIDRTRQLSSRLRNLRRIQPEWIRGWVREWIGKSAD